MTKNKMKLPFFSTSSSSSSSWPWPSCHQPRTLSFRATTQTATITEPPPDEQCSSDDTSIENVIRGLRSERLFFQPGETSSSILQESSKSRDIINNEDSDEDFPFKDSLVLTMESRDPYFDFKKSMEDMVEAHGFKDWKNLEELLCCYLRVNGKTNHGYIVAAFVDLLVGFALQSNTNHQHPRHSPSSPLSFYTSSDDYCSSSTPLEESVCSPCLSSLLEAEDNEIRQQQHQSGDDVTSLLCF